MNQDISRLAANTIRTLAMDAVQESGNGHPGMPMGMADIAVVLWRDFLRHNPADPDWPDRDRFVLSAGHGSMLLYALLHLTGYDLPLAQIKNLRQWGSRTPGHPENFLTPGVETTTGPLGQGVGNAVGFALAERWLAARFNRPDFPIVDHYTYAIASDGDLMEGISHEATSLAGHLGLGKLIVFYDDNGISIDGPVKLSFSEDIPARFTSYGWHTSSVDGHDQAAVAAAIAAAKLERDRPSLIACKTHIGYGSPNKQDTSSAHGSALGEEEVRRTKAALGWDPDAHFYVPDEVYGYMRELDGATQQAAWEDLYAAYQAEHPDAAAAFKAALAGQLPAGWDEVAPEFEAGAMLATRAASGKMLNTLAPHVPTLLGGSADLTGSNKTDLEGADALSRDDFDGRYIHFGIREHGMGGIMNGMALHGGIRPYGGTFLVFSDYMRPSVRLSALMHQPNIYVFTHDSIGLGEDGPTHQPVEHLMSLRLIPNMTVFRPADARETVAGWRAALRRQDGPTALILTRQKVPVLAESLPDGAELGAYVLRDANDFELILMASGSEVSLMLEAADTLAGMGIAARVVSMPSWELFAAQPAAYRDSVLPPTVTARVSLEAGATLGWERYVGDEGIIIGLDRFGASAPYQTIFEQFGLTAEAVVAAARSLVRPPVVAENANPPAPVTSDPGAAVQAPAEREADHVTEMADAETPPAADDGEPA